MNCDGTNIYVSQNAFCFKNKKLNREKDSLKRLNAFYVDIDCYKAGLTQQQVITALREEYYGTIIPVPTFVINSGRGIYLIWKLNNEDCKAYSKWQAIEDYLVDSLIPLGADSCCRDVSRILRVPFSYNSKSNSMVKIEEFNDLVYTIYSISKEYEIYPSYAPKKKRSRVASKAQRWAVSQIASSLGIDMPDFNDFSATCAWLSEHKSYLVHSPKSKGGVRRSSERNYAFASVLRGWRDDLVTLMSLRKGADCRRENALFLYRLWSLELCGDANMALEQTLSFNSTFSCPLPERLVIEATKSAEKKYLKGETYHFSVKRLISFLDISSDELAGLASFAQASNSDTRTLTTAESRKISNHTYYVKSVERAGKDLKSSSVAIRRSRISSLLADGFSSVEIMKELSISRSTFYRDLEFISCAKKEELSLAEQVVEEVEEGSSVVATKNECVDGAFSVVPFFKTFYYDVNSFAVPSRPIFGFRFSIPRDWLWSDGDGGADSS